MNNEDTELAEKAFALCQKNFRANNFDMARIYCLNAISHGDDIKYFQALAAIASKIPKDLQNEAIEQTINILQMALFQVPAEKVMQLKEILDILEKQLTASSVLPDNDVFHASISNDIGVMTEICSGKLSWKHLRATGEISETRTIQLRIRELQQIISEGGFDEKTSKVCNQELQTSIVYLEFLNQHNVIQLHFNQVEEEFSKKQASLFYIAARLQNINTLLNQMWLFDLQGVLSESEFRDFMDSLIKQAQKNESRYNTLRSQPIIVEIECIVKEMIDRISLSAIKKTPDIHALEQTLKEVSAKMMEIPDMKTLEQAQLLSEKLKNKLIELSKQRYARYQSMVAKHCVTAIKAYEYINIVSESDAIKLLEQHKFAQIDESLLCPEAGGLYHFAKGGLISKLSPNENANFQMKCVESQKFKMEDF